MPQPSDSNLVSGIEIIFQHGWGFDALMWRHLLAEAIACQDDRVSFQLADRGYFGQPVPAEAFRYHDSFKVLVAHSLGLHFISPSALASADILLAIGAFASFHDSNAARPAAARRVIARMKERLAEDPLQTLADFYDNCHRCPAAGGDFTVLSRAQKLYVEGAARIDAHRLSCDLDLLDDNRFDPDLVSPIPKVIIVHGTDDAIVPFERVGQWSRLPNATVHPLRGGGHALSAGDCPWLWSLISQGAGTGRASAAGSAGRTGSTPALSLGSSAR